MKKSISKARWYDDKEGYWSVISSIPRRVAEGQWSQSRMAMYGFLALNKLVLADFD
jgi:hypothetical protein